MVCESRVTRRSSNDRHRAEPLGHRRWPPAAPLFRAEIERHALDHRREIRPQRAAALELAQDGVVVVDQPQVDEAGKVLPLRRRQVSPPAGRPYDLIDQIEVVEEQPLIIHVELSGNPPDYRYASRTTQAPMKRICNFRVHLCK